MKLFGKDLIGAENKIAAALSLFLPGLGQIYKGHVEAGLLWLFLGMPAPILDRNPARSGHRRLRPARAANRLAALSCGTPTTKKICVNAIGSCRTTTARSWKMLRIKLRGQISLDHAELHAPGFADHVLIPRRIPDEIDLRFVDAFDAHDFALRIVRDRRSHAATRRGQRHFHFHFCSAVLALLQFAIVDQTEIDDVDRNFRIVALA